VLAVLMTASLKYWDWPWLRSCPRVFVTFALQLTSCLHRKSSDWGIVWYRNVFVSWGAVLRLLHIFFPPNLEDQASLAVDYGLGLPDSVWVFKVFLMSEQFFRLFFVPQYHLMCFA
jgi:hypothetical protein